MTEDEKRELAKEVVNQLMQAIYLDLGQSVFKKVFWLFMAAMIAFGVWAGIIHLPQGVH